MLRKEKNTLAWVKKTKKREEWKKMKEKSRSSKIGHLIKRKERNSKIDLREKKNLYKNRDLMILPRSKTI